MRWRGNLLADVFAKKGAEMHGASPPERSDLKHRWKKALGIAPHAANMFIHVVESGWWSVPEGLWVHELAKRT